MKFKTIKSSNGNEKIMKGYAFKANTLAVLSDGFNTDSMWDGWDGDICEGDDGKIYLVVKDFTKEGLPVAAYCEIEKIKVNESMTVGSLIEKYGEQTFKQMHGSRSVFTVDKSEKWKDFLSYSVDRFENEFAGYFASIDEYERNDKLCPDCHVAYSCDNVCPVCGALDPDFE